eukprot:1346484-Amorphochlora_amoeboformis.AAC.1
MTSSGSVGWILHVPALQVCEPPCDRAEGKPACSRCPLTPFNPPLCDDGLRACPRADDVVEHPWLPA